MVTLKEVARDAGVSVATVSCCLSGKKPVKTGDKITHPRFNRKVKIYSKYCCA